MKEESNKKKAKKKKRIKKGHIKKKLKTLYKQKIIRDFVYFLLAQIFVAFLIICIVYSCGNIDVSKAKTVDITVEEITYYHSTPLSRSMFCVVSDSVEYVFPRPLQDLEKSIHVGDELELRYVEQNEWLTEINYVLDARSGTNVYRTYSGVSKILWGVWCIGLPIVLETIYIFILAIYIWLHKEMLDFRK